jgi:hypothetical protein
MTRRIALYQSMLALLLGCFITSAHEPDGLKLTAVEPKTGVTTPGSKVMIYGSDFSSDAVAYFDGLEARETKFVSPTTLEVTTPYLRPGTYPLQMKSMGNTVRSDVNFTVSPSKIDSAFDHAITLAGQGQPSAAIAILTDIAENSSDYQVRAFAHYQMAKVYFAQGDWWRWAGQAGGIFDSEAGRAVQTSWRYRLAYGESVYLLPMDSDPESVLRLADWTVQYDITQNPEPRFFRGLVNARYGNLTTAKTDSDFILKLEPNNPSYRALAVYVAVLSGEKPGLQSFDGKSITDARALGILGEAAYLSGDLSGAQLWWAQSAKTYPFGASLAYWAGKKHLARGQQRVAEALLVECATMTPDSTEGKDAKTLLGTLQKPTL